MNRTSSTKKKKPFFKKKRDPKGEKNTMTEEFNRELQNRLDKAKESMI